MAFHGIGTKPILTRRSSRGETGMACWRCHRWGKLIYLKTWWVAKEGAKFKILRQTLQVLAFSQGSHKIRRSQGTFQRLPYQHHDRRQETSRHLHWHSKMTTWEKVEKWCKEIDVLSEIAKNQPHCCVLSIHSRWAAQVHIYFLHKIANIWSCLQLLDDAIKNSFITNGQRNESHPIEEYQRQSNFRTPTNVGAIIPSRSFKLVCSAHCCTGIQT